MDDVKSLCGRSSIWLLRRLDGRARGNAGSDDVGAEIRFDGDGRSARGAVTIDLSVTGGAGEEPEIAAPERECPTAADADCGLRCLAENFAVHLVDFGDDDRRRIVETEYASVAGSSQFCREPLELIVGSDNGQLRRDAVDFREPFAGIVSNVKSFRGAAGAIRDKPHAEGAESRLIRDKARGCTRDGFHVDVVDVPIAEKNPRNAFTIDGHGERRRETRRATEHALERHLECGWEEAIEFIVLADDIDEFRFIRAAIAGQTSAGSGQTAVAEQVASSFAALS